MNFAKAKETDDLILLNNIDNDNNDSNDVLTLSEFDSVLSIFGSNESDYLIESLESKKEIFFNTKTSTKSVNPSSSFFVKTALRLKHINLAKIIEQKYIITNETTTGLEKALNTAT
ncbi:17470_t:CDS:2 [Dentiscutata heterogama]|uniref:17470_t:CDS:1 n=1 Tax=Dentiscutata heterogama TaxID=1316150 RepID=A0ACA9NN06_9GLOM|nr:17470_t:CDS:2 [Dentiscutata heterogama]